jgi:hypothetical protein
VKPTNFRAPKTQRLLRVQFRNGITSRFEYTARQLRWGDSGSPWDIVAVQYGEKAA